MSRTERAIVRMLSAAVVLGWAAGIARRLYLAREVEGDDEQHPFVEQYLGEA